MKFLDQSILAVFCNHSKNTNLFIETFSYHLYRGVLTHYRVGNFLTLLKENNKNKNALIHVPSL